MSIARGIVIAAALKLHSLKVMRKIVFFTIARNLNEALCYGSKMTRDQALSMWAALTPNNQKKAKIWTIDARSWRPIATAKTQKRHKLTRK